MISPFARRSVSTVVALTFAAFGLAAAQSVVPAGRHVATDVRRGPSKSFSASKLPNEAIAIDGRLEEPVWKTVAPITDFVQKMPVEGAKPTDSLEIRLA